VTLIPILALLLAGAGGKSADPKKPSVKWEKSFSASLAKAKASGKPIMVDFWAEWCGYCHVLDRTTYRDPKVVKLAADFVSVKVDTEGSDAEVQVASRYLVGSLPTIAFLSPEGRMLMRLNGYIPPEHFAPAMEKAKARAAPIIVLEAKLAKEPQNLDALIQLGLQQFGELTKMAQGDSQQRMSRRMFQDVDALLGKAYRLDKDRTVSERKRVRTALGLLRGYEGKFKEAVALLKESLAIKPVADEDARSFLGLGEIYMMEGKEDLARVEFKRVVDGFPAKNEAALAREYLEGMP
jgi:thiol-disulfide isomerase/thioredoxin